MKNESLPYLHSVFSAKYKYKTKQAHNGMLRHTRDLGLEINQNSFRWRAAKSYNELPLEIKNIPTLEGFKKGVKTWIKQNTSLYQDWAFMWIGAQVYHPLHIPGWRFSAKGEMQSIVLSFILN